MAWTAKDFLDENIAGLTLIEDDIGQASTIDHLFFSKGMATTHGIENDIYDTESYYEEEKTTSSIFDDVDLSQVYVQILKHNYEKEEYEYTTVSDELPHFNMPWRNAITFLGRIVHDDGTVLYKGTIILQYDGTYHNVIVVKPYQVNFGMFNQEDPLSITYNALDPAPFVFEDLMDERADVFSFPTVLGVIPYNTWFELPFTWDPEPYGEEYLDAKTFSSFTKHQRMYLKPYIAMPAMPQYSDADYFKLKMRIQLHPDDEGEELILSDSVDGGTPIINWAPTQAFLDKIYDLSRSHNQVIRISLITEAVDDISKSYVDEDNDDNGHVPLGDIKVKEESVVVDNLLKSKNKLRYNINVYTEELTAPGAPSASYRSDITISHEEPIINPETQEVVNFKRYEKVVRVFSAYHNIAPLTLGQKRKTKVDFKGLEFKIQLGSKAGDYYLDVYSYSVDIEIDADTRDRYTSTGTTQPIIVRGERIIDPEEMLKHHNLRKATMLKNLDRFGVLYGPHMGSNVIQFTGYDQLSHAPFPFHAIDFDSEVIHIHTHRNNLYVFTNNGLYILHDGFGPLDMKKTFAYANIGLNHSDKNTVVSFGNEVFYISKGVGYSIRTNVNVESQDDVYVQPVTHPIGDLLKNPAAHVKKRLEEGYGKILDVENSIKTHYYVKPLSNELYIFATYYVENENDEEAIMVTYIFDRDYRRWRTYDTIAGMQPVIDLNSGYAKGFDLVMKNHYKDKAHTTYASYLQRLPDNDLQQYISDVSVVKKEQNNVVYDLFEREDKPDIYKINPISAMIDSGSLGLNPMHTKKIRRIMTNFMDLRGDHLRIYVVPHVDNNDYQNRISVEIALGESEEYTPNYIQNLKDLDLEYSGILPMITPQNVKQEGFRLSIGTMQSTKKLSMLTQMNAKGKLPGFRIYLFANDQFKIGDYGIVYRQQKAR